jgi:hypothetical protein
MFHLDGLGSVDGFAHFRSAVHIAMESLHLDHRRA